MSRSILVAVWLVVSMACFPEPDVGALLSPSDASSPDAIQPACADGDPATELSLARDIRPILARCTCHGSSATSGLALFSYEGLRRGGVVAGATIVVPRLPCDSVLYQKIRPTPPFGSRMPYNGPPYLSTDEIAAIRDWIAEGAHDN